MAHFTNLPVREQDFHNIKADLNLRILDESQIIQRGLGNPPPLPRIHSGRRTNPILGRPRFYFYKGKAITFLKYQVDLSTRRAKICREKFQSEPLEIFPGRALAQFAALLRDRLFLAAAPGLDALPEVHALDSSKSHGLV